MRCSPLQIMVLLVLGAVINVGVAWWCAVHCDFYREQATTSRQGSNWVSDCRRAGGMIRITRSVSGPTMTVADRRGWPLPALQSNFEPVFTCDWRMGDVVCGIQRRDKSERLGKQPWADWALPLLPVWPGFLVNTVLYALAAWPIARSPFVLRGWFRKRRGVCPACTYPAGTSSVCTECGTPVRVRATRSGG